EVVLTDRLEQVRDTTAAVTGEREGAGETGAAIVLAAGAGLDGADRGDVAEARQAFEGGPAQIRIPRRDLLEEHRLAGRIGQPRQAVERGFGAPGGLTR